MVSEKGFCSGIPGKRERDALLKMMHPDRRYGVAPHMHHRLDQNFVNDGSWNARLNVEWEKWQKLSPEVQTEQMLEAMQAEIGRAKRESERWNSVFGGVWGAKNRQRVWEERLRRAKEANTFFKLEDLLTEYTGNYDEERQRDADILRELDGRDLERGLPSNYHASDAADVEDDVYMEGLDW